MKTKYGIFSLNSKTVCVPSTDYYARGDNWQTDYVKSLLLDGEYDSYELALEAIERDFTYEDKFLIIPIIVR